MEKSIFATSLSSSTIIWLLTNNSEKLYNMIIVDGYLKPQLELIGYMISMCPETKTLLYYQKYTDSRNTVLYKQIPSRTFFIAITTYKIFLNLPCKNHQILKFYSKPSYEQLNLYKCVETIMYYFYWKLSFPIYICDFLYAYFLKQKTESHKLSGLLTNITNKILFQIGISRTVGTNDFIQYQEQLSNIHSMLEIIHTINVFSFIDSFDSITTCISLNYDNIFTIRHNHIKDPKLHQIIFDASTHILTDGNMQFSTDLQKHKYFLIHLIYDDWTVRDDLLHHWINVCKTTSFTTSIPISYIDYAFRFESYNFITKIIDDCAHENNIFLKEILDKTLFYDNSFVFKYLVSKGLLGNELSGVLDVLNKYSHNISFCMYNLINSDEKIYMMKMLINKRHFGSINALYDSIIAIDDLEGDSTNIELFSNMFGLCIENFISTIQEYHTCVEKEIVKRTNCSINELLTSTSKCKTNFSDVIKNYCMESMPDATPYNNYKIMFGNTYIKTHIDRCYLMIENEYKYIYTIHFDNDIMLGNLMLVNAIGEYNDVVNLLYLSIILGSRACFLLLIKTLLKISDRSRNKFRMRLITESTKYHLKRIIIQADLWFHIQLYKMYLITIGDIQEIVLIYNDRRIIDFMPNMSNIFGLPLCLRIIKEDRIKLLHESFSNTYIVNNYKNIYPKIVKSHSPLCWDYITKIMNHQHNESR